ncbi:phage holin [Aminipila luticellarii]|uniref:Phage holin n=1 Tax=Aminipila luticellarii TaxID=2507160 RepID=A0A410PWW8_9FIRM|nr:phage holin [Aminipila luticellarii]QAT43427.1 phage holin [Aminipila luticellarii]
MKINWKLRLKNKTTLAALVACVVAFVYQVLGILGITAPISQDQVAQGISIVINLLVAVGVLVDPTTSGTGDSTRALTYKKPN